MSAVARRKLPYPPQLALVPPQDPAPESSPDDFTRAPRKRQTGVSPKKFAEATERAAAMAASGDWSKAHAIDFVALFATMHARVYGVAPVMTSAERLTASFMAAGFMRAQFGNEPQELADFLWWTWSREKEREKYRRENGRSGGSISWGLQFSARMLTDYRIAEARKASQKG